MTQYYPNKSHILIKTGILLQTAKGLNLDLGAIFRVCRKVLTWETMLKNIGQHVSVL